MKIGILILSMLIPSVLIAAEVPKTIPPGKFGFQDFSVQAKKRYETVYTFTNSGRDRLKILQQNEYSCRLKSPNTYLCSAFLSPHGAESEIAAKVQKQLFTLSIEFLTPIGEPQLISETSLLTEWKIPQEVHFKGKEHASYRLLQSTHLEKIFLGSNAEETFVYDDRGNLNYPVQFSLTESKTSYFIYFVLASFQFDPPI